MPQTTENSGEYIEGKGAPTAPLSGNRTAQTPAARATCLCFAVIFLMGVGVRLTHLSSESVWWDEFATVAFLDVSDCHQQSPHYERWNQQVIRRPPANLSDFRAQNRLVDPAAMPLYLGIEYFWNKYVHHSVVSLRLLSVIFGVSVLPLIFLLGRKLFNARAGLVSMFCAAMSPIHVQFSKEIRMYSVMTLLALALVIIFVCLLQSRQWRWWVLYALVALLLSWTHPFAVLLPFTLGVFWVTAYPGDIRRIIAWGALNACVLLPAAVYVLTIQFWGEDTTGGWMRLPTLSELAADIFADDAIGMTYQVNATPTAFSKIFGGDMAAAMLRWRWNVGRVMIAGALATSIGLLFAAYGRDRKGKRETPAARTRCDALKRAYLLLLWLVLPPLVLYVVSMCWRPCIMPRYTVHCSLALYLIVGGAVSMISMRVLRVAAVSLVCLFYGYQQLLMIGEPQHPDWYGATALIRERGADNDLVLCHNWLWKRVFAFNLGPTPFVVGYGSSHDILAEQSAFFLSEMQAAADTARLPVVWIAVRTDYFERGPMAELEHALGARGLLFEFFEFRGIQHVLAYRVWTEPDKRPVINPNQRFQGEAPKEFADLALEYWRAAQYETAVAFADYANRIAADYARAWSYKGMALKELGRREEALEAFQRAVTIDRLDYPWSHVNIAMLLVDLERYDEAVNAALRALDILPDDAWAYAMLGRAQLGLREYDAALASLRRAAMLNSGDMRIQQMLGEAEEAVSRQL
ncbi:MAG TPA: tetratricopeptide repeat protein [Candidatus Hydrogenedentes bacterium]|nr:tetratricopeptide repeat protein [Candidatus Hydrogenedentota bacterium]